MTPHATGSTSTPGAPCAKWSDSGADAGVANPKDSDQN